MTVVIIEDELRTAKDLNKMLNNIDDTIEVVAMLDSVEKSVQWFCEHKHPDLIFSDIQIADGICFEIFQKVQIKSPVIFCTAFDSYTLAAFDTNAVSYLLKPLTIEKVEKALEKFTQMKSAFDEEKDRQKIADLISHLKYAYKTTLLVHHKDKIIPVQVKDIAYFYLDNTLVNICTMSNQKYFLSSTMEELEKMVTPEIFYRANRQYLVNRNAISDIERFFARKLVAKLNVATPEPIVISKAKATEFLQWLEGDMK
jgi:two-component system response regulator LytT